jgi:hypothetical protein
VSGFSPQSTGFNSVLVHVKLMVGEMLLGRVFFPISIVALKLPTDISLMRTVLFWVITQTVVVVSYRRFWTTCRFPSSVGFLTPEDGIDRFARNVGNKLRLLVA